MRGYLFLSLVVSFAATFPVPIATTWLADEPPPLRQRTILQTYTEHEWWLLAWADNSLACRVFTDQEGKPSLNEIRSDCLPETYQRFLAHPLCDAATYGGDLSTCQGYYLHYIDSHQAERETVVELPPATASLVLEGCIAAGHKTLCPDLPVFKITGLEPLAEHSITQVHFEYRGRQQVCLGSVCEVQLWPTTLAGEPISFWVDSSYGDSSEVYEAYYRMKPNGDENWQIQVISELGVIITDKELVIRNQANVVTWQAFPPLGENPPWLSYPEEAAALASAEPYQYLAGQLIQSRVANASACADGGLLFDGYASQCGLEAAMAEVIRWQNRFDAAIFEAAQRYALSPQLLKNLIAQESQFWPGEYAISPHEYGLARLTVTGADTLFMWNAAFYESFCAPLLSEETCTRGYNQLMPVHQDMLRGALAARVNLACVICEYGFDESRAAYGIEVLAQSLLANAAQVEQIFKNLNGEPAGASASYEDLWRFTLVNYNTGAGCLGAALTATQRGHAELNWAYVSAHLVGGCRDAIRYVENITK